MKKILIIGLGSIGLRHLNNTRKLLPESDIAIYRQHSLDDGTLPEKADRIFYTLEDALSYNPDAVIIASPASLHCQNAISFFKNDAHIFIEKPLAIEVKETTELIEISKKSDYFVMVGYVLRFQPIFLYLKSIIEQGRIGKVYTAQVDVGQFLPDWRPRNNYRSGVSAQKKLGGGVLLELSHELDYSTWLFGQPDNIICSYDKISNLEIDVEDSATVIMEYHQPNKKKIVINLDFLQRTANMSLKVIGSEGTLTANLIKETASLEFSNANVEELTPPRLQNGNDAYLRQFDFFFASSFKNYKRKFPDLENYENYATLSSALKTLKVVDAARKSNDEGCRVSLKRDLNA